ncbi:MAG: [ribosomal protein S18]-alanine N-acetyltransferase [Acidobacteriaceae bacterium]|nr:[ribosomal protein S18]-alanine N-acetyltransferase [Acidobacteriaceae bacterium]
MLVLAYQPRDFDALYELDQSCFPRGIAYSKTTLRYFLALLSAQCLLAVEEADIAGFILTERDGPLAHIITLDVVEAHRRSGVGSLLLNAAENNLAAQGARTAFLETAVNNHAAVSFWLRHGYIEQGILKRYYLNRIDGYEMSKTLPSAQKQ